MTPRRFRKGGIVLRFLLAIVLLIALGAGAAYLSLTIPYRGFAKPVILDFPRGTSTAEMANQLAQSGVIRYPWQFLIVRVLRPDARANTNFPNLRQRSESMPESPAGMCSSMS
jgi:cell division protein YceG involved in septum cleavage